MGTGGRIPTDASKAQGYAFHGGSVAFLALQAAGTPLSDLMPRRAAARRGSHVPFRSPRSSSLLRPIPELSHPAAVVRQLVLGLAGEQVHEAALHALALEEGP